MTLVVCRVRCWACIYGFCRACDGRAATDGDDEGPCSCDHAFQLCPARRWATLLSGMLNHEDDGTDCSCEEAPTLTAAEAGLEP